MRALLLSAGFGTRLRPITDNTPKCLVEVNNKPLMEYWFDILFPSKIERVLINTHYLPKAVEDFVSKASCRKHIDIVYEPVLLGTGGTILQNENFFQKQAFIVAHADNLTFFDLDSFLLSHQDRPEGCEITMMTFQSDQPESCGIVELDSNGIVIRFHEKVKNPPGSIANAAVYIFEPTVIQFLKSLNKKIIDLSTEVLPYYLGKINTFHNYNYHRDIGTSVSLGLANKDMLLKKAIDA